jgi:type II secretory ATPase GspE/PulE/Tfp pilus assembly ATPase PilB-like protein
MAPGPAVRRAVLARQDATGIAEAARSEGWRSLREAADDLFAEGKTTAEEVRRVLGT